MTTTPVEGPNVWQDFSGYLPDLYTYRQLDEYYMGRQPLSFLPPEIARATMGRLRSLMVNWPRLVIDSLEERLDVEGFRLGGSEAADDNLWMIWQANDLDEWSQQCHVEALLHGRSYVLVWADELDATLPRISVESSAQMSIEFAPGTTTITKAVKSWVENDMTAYMTVYYPNTIERYSTPIAGWNADIALTRQAWELREAPLNHDLGEVPVVPFVNRPRLSRPFGESELADVIPLADAVNKLATDMMVTSEYHASKRRWATGLEIPTIPESKDRFQQQVAQQWDRQTSDKTWLGGPNVRFGEFSEANLSNFVEAINLLAGQIAALSGLPPHYLGLKNEGNPASADAIRSSEAALVKRAERKQRVFGGSWERVMRLALRVQSLDLPPEAEAMETIWRDPNTPTIAEKVDAASKLDAIGLPLRQNLEDLGYTPTQIDRIQLMRGEDALATVRQQLAAADQIIKDFGLSRAAALAVVGLDDAAQVEARVEAKEVSPSPAENDPNTTGAQPAAPPPAPPAV